VIGLTAKKLDDVGRPKPLMWIGDWDGPSLRARQAHALRIASASLWLQVEAARTGAQWAVLCDDRVELWITRPEKLYCVPVVSFAADELLVATALLGARYKGLELAAEGLSP
jgi:hypothetical protein